MRCYDDSEELPRLSTPLRSYVSRAFQSTALLFAVALLARLYAIRSSPIFLPDPRDHLVFGAEAGRIARSLIEGRSYADPFLGPSGPTAWLGPVYPLTVAAAFKLFGVYSTAAGVAVLAVNAACAAITCVVMRALGRMTFGENAGLIAAWSFALLPFEIAWASRWVWDTSLSTLLLVLLVLLTLRLQQDNTARNWFFFAALWGVIILTNGTLVSLLPASAAWLLLQRGKIILRPLIAAVVLALVIAAPWWLRNWHTFHRFIPLRSNFAMELYLGNHDGADGLIMFWDHPLWNDEEMQRYREMGEIAYIADKGRIARAWIAAHPAEFARISAKRVLTFWAGVPGAQRAGRRSSLAMHHGFVFAASLFAWIGALYGCRRRVPGAGLFVCVLAVYPLVYYITHTHLRYRAPIEPLMMIAGAGLFASAFASGRQRADQVRELQREEVSSRE